MSKESEIIGIYNAALAAVDPYQAVLNAARLEHDFLLLGGEKYNLKRYKRIVVVGAGKATSRMAMAIERLLGERISAGLIVVKEGHCSALNIIRQIEASHPVPNQAGEEATTQILKMAQSADEETLLICLFSGGASALLVAPAAGLSLADKQEVTRLLLQSGATINELNAVRKHLSAVKGGGLAQAAFPAQVVTLIMSDVIGDRVDVIASGPTATDESTFAEAWGVIEKYHLQKKIPLRVEQQLQQGLIGGIKETVKAGDLCMQKTQNVIVAGNKLALHAAQEKAHQAGLHAEIISMSLDGEARDAAKFLAQQAHDALSKMLPRQHLCLLSGGETSVTVKGAGMGGRNQELALAFALEIEGEQGITLLSAGTDGSDGANDAAGAIVTGNTAVLARNFGLSPEHYLEENDSYHFFQKLDILAEQKSHFITGPSGTNVMDLQIILLEKI